jgi:hypothetical protein
LDFLKKHYEKLILAFFLLVFVILLIYLIDLGKSTRAITKEKLRIPTREPNYTPKDFTEKRYQVDYIFSNNLDWKKSVARVDKDNIYTDLMVPYKCARCPFGGKVIPRYYFMGDVDQPRTCPLCAKPLERPLSNTLTPVPPTGGGLDRDNDGIPNSDEVKYKLNPDSPDDAAYDLDGDGFPNIFEYQQGTKLDDPKSHPPMFTRLYLVDFKQTLLPFKLKLVNTGGEKDPRDWVIQINQTDSGKTKFKYLDSSLLLDNVQYRIVKINPKYTEERVGGTIIKKDESNIILKSNDGKYEIVMQVDQPVYSPKPKAVIEDLGKDRKYYVGTNDVISMVLEYEVGSRKIRRTYNYKVIKVDTQEKNVEIRDNRGNTHVITTKKLMPRIKRNDGRSGMSPMGVPGEPGMPPELMEAPPGMPVPNPGNVRGRRSYRR